VEQAEAQYSSRLGSHSAGRDQARDFEEVNR
ncbi:hypothetical protein LCGC14_1945240, partial [marine sediment metagenome]